MIEICTICGDSCTTVQRGICAGCLATAREVPPSISDQPQNKEAEIEKLETALKKVQTVSGRMRIQKLLDEIYYEDENWADNTGDTGWISRSLSTR